jgi:calcium/calmodulin-dependent protein kinase I
MSGQYEYDDEYWSDISNSAKNLIDRLLTFDPNERITAQEALQHPWITDSNKKEGPLNTNLAPAIRKGYSSRGSLGAIAILNQRKPSTSDDSTTSGGEEAEVKVLDIHAA